jgi:hypothetical protein
MRCDKRNITTGDAPARLDGIGSLGGAPYEAFDYRFRGVYGVVLPICWNVQ